MTECVGQCGRDHRQDPLNDEFDPDDRRCAELNGDAHTITGARVVLTVAHLDHTPEHVDEANLVAMCQRRRRRALGDLFEAAP